MSKVEWLSGTAGSVFVRPEHVTAVENGPYETLIHLVGGQTITLHDERSTEQIVDDLFGAGTAAAAV